MPLPLAPTRALRWAYRTATRAFPIAEAALNLPRTAYDFHGVILVRPRAMERLVSQRAHKNLPVPSVRRGQTVCAFAFTGNFPGGQVAGSPTNDSGKAAIVLVTTNHKLALQLRAGQIARRLQPSLYGRLVQWDGRRQLPSPSWPTSPAAVTLG